MPCYASDAAHSPEVCRIVLCAVLPDEALLPGCTTCCLRLSPTCRMCAGGQQAPRSLAKCLIQSLRATLQGKQVCLSLVPRMAALELSLTHPYYCVQGRKRKAPDILCSLKDDAEIETEPDLESMAAAIQLFKQQADM